MASVSKAKKAIRLNRDLKKQRGRRKDIARKLKKEAVRPGAVVVC